MTTLREAREQVRAWISQYPELKGKITGFWELCLSEIEDGGSEQQEVDSMMYDIRELIDEWRSEVSSR